MDRISKSSSRSTSRSAVDSSAQKREEELKRKSDLERERVRLEREAKDLFGDDSFVPTPSLITPSPPPPTHSKATSHPIPLPTTGSTSHQSPGVKKAGFSTKAPAQPVAVKKAATSGGFWPLGKPDHVKETAPVVKKAGEGLSGPKKISVPKPVSPALVQGAMFKPAPLPDVKYADPSKSSGLPSLADWRKGITRGFDSAAPVAKRESEGKSERKEKSRERERVRELEEEEEEDDWIVNSDDSASDDDESIRRAKKKRKAEDKMDKMWAELRKITGYDPRSAKYVSRDKTSIREASHDEVNHEERQTKVLGRLEDKQEEDRDKRSAQLKKDRKDQWKRSRGISTSSDEDDDPY